MMLKVTKFVHSCLFVETQNLGVLIDPGRYSWESHLLDPVRIENLTHIVLTHEHGDHYYEPALKALAKHFPHAVIVTNNDLAQKIAELKLPNQIQTGSDDNILVFETPHEKLPLKAQLPLNVGVHINGILTHPGDSLSFNHTREILALPVSGPRWTNLKIGLEKVVKLKPKKVISIHDWHWHKQAREEVYKKTKEDLASQGIELVELENGEPVEL